MTDDVKLPEICEQVHIQPVDEWRCKCYPEGDVVNKAGEVVRHQTREDDPRCVELRHAIAAELEKAKRG